MLVNSLFQTLEYFHLYLNAPGANRQKPFSNRCRFICTEMLPYGGLINGLFKNGYGTVYFILGQMAELYHRREQRF